MHGEGEAIKCVSDGRGRSEPDRPGPGGAGSTGRSGVGLGGGAVAGGALSWEQREGWGWERPGDALSRPALTAGCGSWLFKPRLCSSFQCFSSFFFCRLRFLVKKWQQVDGRGALAPGQALHPGTSDPKCFRAGFLLRAKWEDPKPRERPATQPVHLSGGSGIVKKNGFYLGYRHSFV